MDSMDATAPAMINVDGEAAPTAVNIFAATLSVTTADVSRTEVSHEVEPPCKLLDLTADLVEVRKESNDGHRIPDKAHELAGNMTDDSVDRFSNKTMEEVVVLDSEKEMDVPLDDGVPLYVFS